MPDDEPPADFANFGEWPEGLYAHLDRFRQGHLVEGLPLAYVGSTPPLWPGAVAGESKVGDALVRVVDQSIAHAMLVTQACDLMKPGAWATVVPVYDAAARLDRGHLGNARTGRTLHLVALSPGWAAEGELWVADLRLEVPVEKRLLLGKEPLEAFLDPAEYGVLRDRLGATRQRNAVATPAWDLVLTPLFAALAEDEPGWELLDTHVREFRVQCNDPTSPTMVQVFVVLHEDEPEGRIERLVDDALSTLREGAQAGGVTIPPVQVSTLWEMTAQDYVTSDSVDRDSGS